MSKKILLVLAIILLGISYSIFQNKEIKIDVQNASYFIEGKKITLINGKSEEAIDGSSSKIITQYFGNEIKDDFNGDNLEDSAFILIQNSGGTGTFYYLAVALGTKNGYGGINTVFLGDRIFPQAIEIENEKIVVKYKNRDLNEPMTSIPSVENIEYFKIINKELIKI